MYVDSSNSFILVENVEGKTVLINRYNRGQKIVNWLFYAKTRLLYPGVENPVKELINALSDDARNFAIAAGLDVNASFDTVFNKLIEIFRFEGRNPTIWTLFSKRLCDGMSAEFLAEDIRNMTVEIFNRNDKEELIRQTALEAFLNALKPSLAKIILQAHPSSIDQALAMLPTARRLLVAQTSPQIPTPPKILLSSKLYECLLRNGKSQHSKLFPSLYPYH